MKRNERRPPCGLLQHLRAQNVGGHQVRRELDAARLEAEHRAERIDQLGLGEAGHADDEAVAAGQDGDQRVLDDLLLAEDDRGDGLARLADLVDGGFGGMHDGGIETGGVRELSAHGVTPSCSWALRPRRVRPAGCYPSKIPGRHVHYPRMHHSCQCPPNSPWPQARLNAHSRLTPHDLVGCDRRSPRRGRNDCPGRHGKANRDRTKLTVSSAWGETVAAVSMAARTQSALGRRRIVNSIRPSSSSRHHSISVM